MEALKSALYAYMAHYATRCSPTSLSSLQVPPISNDSSLAIQTLRNVIQSRSSASRPHSNGINGHNGDWREQSIQKILNGLFKELNIQEFDQDQMEVDGENWQIGLMQELQAHFNRFVLYHMHISFLRYLQCSIGAVRRGSYRRGKTTCRTPL